MNRTVAASHPDDLALARQCAVGDPGSVRAVTSANNQRLFRAAWSVLKDRTEAEDAVQSAYLKAFASADTFEARSSLSTWLTRIVINEALGRQRSLKRRRSFLEAEGVSMLIDYRTEDAPDKALAREQIRRLIEHAIGSLPDAFRTVFILREVEGFSVQETAEVLDVPPATVKTRLLRARRKLQQSLAPDIQSALVGSFPFAGADCERMTSRLLKALPR